jgi:hypothetical protein
MNKPHMTNNRTNRRNFLKNTAAITAAGLSISSILSSTGCSESIVFPFGGAACRLNYTNNTVLFQGDSITDSGRNRKRQNNANDPGAMGTGYVLLAASQLLDRYSKVKPNS